MFERYTEKARRVVFFARYDELMNEFERVAALRQFGPDTEALLRSLATKGLVDPQHLPKLVFDLRDEKKLAEFVEKLRRL